MTIKDILNVPGVMGTAVAIVDDFQDQQVVYSGYSENIPTDLKTRQVSYMEPSDRIRITDKVTGSSYTELGLYIAIE